MVLDGEWICSWGVEIFCNGVSCIRGHGITIDYTRNRDRKLTLNRKYLCALPFRHHNVDFRSTRAQSNTVQ